ncbi:MAG: DUF2384 domain-containing protein [Sphaerobacter sp.]|nr:DUF2384 domain-containing protein [Sphaerobacter sp.]
MSPEIAATPELAETAPTIRDPLRRFKERLNALQPAEMEAVLEAATRALSPVEEPVPAVIDALTGGRRFTAAERAEAEIDVLMRSFARRRELLAGALTASQVARLLGTSRQTSHDRLAAGTLLAVMDQGAWRFPVWQFDPEGENGVVPGLPAVIRALRVSPLAKISWLTRPNPILDGETPLACLKAGQVERVVALARAVGAE